MDSLFVAVVQLDYQPAFTHKGRDFLCEPSLPALPISQSPHTLFDLEVKLQELNDFAANTAAKQVKNWRETIRQSYKQWITSKLQFILEFAAHKNIDIIVLPEYSVPCNVLGDLHASLATGLLVAGTHSVTAQCLDSCVPLGVEVSHDDISRSVCPVLIKSGKIHTLHKIELSQWESGNLEGTAWSPIELSWKGHEYLLLIQVCIDFLGNNAIFQTDKIKNRPPLTVLRAVPSLTRTVYPFDVRAEESAQRQGEVVLFANSAAAGGTRIAFIDHTKASRPLQGPIGTWSAKPGEEVIIIAEIRPHLWARPGSPALIPTPQPAVRPVAVVPIHYSGTSDLDDMIEFINRSNVNEIRSYFQREQINLPITAEEPTLTAKLRELAHGITGLPDSDVGMLAEVLICPAKVSSMNEWRCFALAASACFLDTLRQTGIADICSQFAVRFRESAESLAAGLGFTFEELSKKVEFKDLLELPVRIAARLSSAPSSGQAEWALIRWVENAFSDGNGEISSVRSVVQLVETLRPYPLKQTANMILRALTADSSSREAALKVCNELRAERVLARARLIAEAEKIELIREGDLLLSYGYSSSLISILHAFARRKSAKTVTIAVAECKNRLGVDSAPHQIEQLVNMGFRCNFVAAEALARYVTSEKPVRVIFGANAIVSDGVINTMGSLALATIANSIGRPPIVIAPINKIWPQNFWLHERSELLNMQRPSDRVIPKWMQHSEDIKLVSYAYDLISFRWLHMIVTDMGIFSTDDSSISKLLSYAPSYEPGV